MVALCPTKTSIVAAQARLRTSSCFAELDLKFSQIREDNKSCNSHFAQSAAKITIAMGQRSSRCKEAEKDFGRVHLHHGTSPQSSTSLVEAHPHPVSVGEENVGGGKKKGRKEDTSKKKTRFRLWRWTSCWRAGQKYSRKTSSAQREEEAQGTEADAVPYGIIPGGK